MCCLNQETGTSGILCCSLIFVLGWGRVKRPVEEHGILVEGQNLRARVLKGSDENSRLLSNGWWEEMEFESVLLKRRKDAHFLTHRYQRCKLVPLHSYTIYTFRPSVQKGCCTSNCSHTVLDRYILQTVINTVALHCLCLSGLGHAPLAAP